MFRRQVPLPVHDRDALLDCGYIAHIIVDDRVILELKSIERMLWRHEARLTKCRIGLLINFKTVSSLTE